MEELRETKTFIMRWVAILNLILISFSMIFFDTHIAFGFFVGGLMAIINFNLLSKSLEKAVKFPPAKAGAYIFIQYIIRYILWFAVFYIALQREDVNLLTTVLGMLTVKLVIIVSNAFNFSQSNQEFLEIERKEGS